MIRAHDSSFFRLVNVGTFRTKWTWTIEGSRPDLRKNRVRYRILVAQSPSASLSGRNRTGFPECALSGSEGISLESRYKMILHHSLRNDLAASSCLEGAGHSTPPLSIFVTDAIFDCPCGRGITMERERIWGTLYRKRELRNSL